jgi:Membrane domain of glycerophosphoryl diester phosphodiesterase
MPLDLRPLTLAELLDRSFSTYKRHLWLFVGIMGVPAAVGLIPTIVLRLLNTPPPASMPPDQVFAHMLPVLVGSMIFALVYMLVHAIALGATSIAVADLYRGRATTIGLAYQQVRPKGGRLTLLFVWGLLRLGGAWFGLTAVAVLVSLVLGFVTRILAAIFFPLAFLASFVLVAVMAVRYGVAVPVVVLEDVPASGALRRSVELTQGNLGRVFLLILCAAIIAYATAAILQGPFLVASVLSGPGSPLSTALTIAGAILGAIGGMFSGPLMIIGLAMMYYDLRIRKEALDLQLLLENLDAPQQS